MGQYLWDSVTISPRLGGVNGTIFTAEMPDAQEILRRTEQQTPVLVMVSARQRCKSVQKRKASWRRKRETLEHKRSGIVQGKRLIL